MEKTFPGNETAYTDLLHYVRMGHPAPLILLGKRGLGKKEAALSVASHILGMVDVFPAGRQQQIRLQLSMCLRAVLSQQLLPKTGGGRVAACEVMKTDSAIRNLIREGKTPQILNAIQTSGSLGNVLMDTSQHWQSIPAQEGRMAGRFI